MAAKLSGPGGGSKFDLGQNSDINVTPFVDVMLVLLIIFMVTAPLATLSIKLDLPPAQPSNPNTKPKPPTIINLQQSGNIFVGTGDSTRATTLESLIPDVKNELTSHTNDTVFIRADKHVKYSRFMAVVNKLQDAGIYKIALITEDLSNEA
jgi:biopolymer transport protein ExbD